MGPSEHLGAKINNPIAAVSGCPQALDSLNYLSVVSRRGQGRLPLSVCLRAETNERVSSIAPPHQTPQPHDGPSRPSFDPDRSAVTRPVQRCQSSVEW